MIDSIEFVEDGNITSATGFFAGATYSGIKQNSDSLDLGLLISETPCLSFGLFTCNQFKAAPVELCIERLSKNPYAKAIIANSGIANAGTGKEGLRDAYIVAKFVANEFNLESTDVLVCSTGIIGQKLPLETIKNGLLKIKLTKSGGHKFAKSIMTTDSVPKEAAIRVNGDYVIAAVAKGSGMIHPNMGTMLCFVTTDAKISPEALKTAFNDAVEASLNMVTIDGDTSPNDSVIILANGQSQNEVILPNTEAAYVFGEALRQILIYIAKKIASDGEGATKLMEVTVTGGKEFNEAAKVARAIASSLLVKTAIHGADPNWGRIVAAAGRSCFEMDFERVSLSIGNIKIINKGRVLNYNKKAAELKLHDKNIFISLDLDHGSGRAVAWGCDLSKEYVHINSEYTT
jgi:glutamate N-acetyltransferase/amino-acid N-acetyltransferase